MFIKYALVFCPKYRGAEKHLRNISKEVVSVYEDLARVATGEECAKFISSIRDLTKGTIIVYTAIANRNKTRLAFQKAVYTTKLHKVHQRYRPTPQPWEQFLSCDAPGLPIVHFLPPYASQAPRDRRNPHFVHEIKNTVVQAFPQATGAILMKWTSDYRKIVRYYLAV